MVAARGCQLGHGRRHGASEPYRLETLSQALPDYWPDCEVTERRLGPDRDRHREDARIHASGLVEVVRVSAGRELPCNGKDDSRAIT